MNWTRLSAVLMGLAFIGLCLTASALEVPLTVEEQQGIAGPRRVTCGVPLLVGQAKDAKDLRLLSKDAAGKTAPVPAQFRELARWWRADNSIRWVLVDFAAEVGAKESKTFVLTDAQANAAAPQTKLLVEQTADLITVTTGPAKFVVNRKKFNFLDKAIVDLNGDGRLTDDENLLASTADCGIVLEDTFGQKYFASEGTGTVEVIESGPMRVRVRAKGKQIARDGKGYAPGLYGHDVFLNFYAGSADVYADLVVTNNPPKSTGIQAFEDGSLLLKLAGGATGCKVWGGKSQSQVTPRPPNVLPGLKELLPTGNAADAAAKPVEAKLAAGESVCLYQDSNGADTWQDCPGFGKMDTSGWKRLPVPLTTFRGYKILKRAGGKEEELATGDHARGLLHVWNDRGGVIAHVKNFWQQFPKASEAAADGTVRLGLWPREWKFPHYLQDCSAKGYEIVLHFYGTKGAPDEYVTSNRPQAETVADCWDARVFAKPSAEHRAAAGALSDLGPYTPPTKGLDKKPGSGTAANHSRMFTDDRLYGNAYGWRIFGERWRSNGGHGTLGARQPIDEDNYLYRWYVAGAPEWLAAGDARSRQFRDVRCYRIDDQDALGFKDWAEFRKANTSERREWTNRPQPADDEAKKYQAGLPDYGRGWEFPNPEHCVLDLLYDRYLIFGDIRSLENMRVAAGHGGYFALGNTPAPAAKKVGGSLGRAQGWSWRTLERYWDLTGDKEAGELLKAVIKAYEPLIGKSPLWFADDQFAHASDWFTQIFTRAAAMTALHTGDPKAIEICKSLAEGKEKPWAGSVTYGKQTATDAKQFSTLFAVLYHLTGDQKYKDPLAEAIKGDGMLNVGGYFPASDYWLLTQPPQAKK